MIIEQIVNSTDIDEKTKESLAKDYALTFVNAIDYNEQSRKAKNRLGRANLTEIHKGLKNSDIVRKNEVYECYSYYSKYDHMSHWTGRTNAIPVEKRIHRVNLCIMMLMMHLRDLLAIACDFGENNKELEQIMIDFNKYMYDNLKEE